MTTGILVLLSAIALSILAGYISIIGMTALFPGGGFQIIAMMATLEISKIFVTLWIHKHWWNKSVNFAHRAYLIFAVLSLMVLTSIGIFGYLSRSHLDQEAPIAGIEIQMEQLTQKIDQIKVARKNLDERKAQFDQSLATILKNSKTAKDGKTTQAIMSAQRKDRDQITTDMVAKDTAINALSDQLATLKLQSSEVAAKLGPIKYLATTFGISNPNFAVEAVIILITLVFDPLAILLFLAAIISFEGGKKDGPAPAPLAAPSAIVLEPKASTSNETSEIDTAPQPPLEHEVSTSFSAESMTNYGDVIDKIYHEVSETAEALRARAVIEEPDKKSPVSFEFSITPPHLIVSPPPPKAKEPITDRVGPEPLGFAITRPLPIVPITEPASTEPEMKEPVDIIDSPPTPEADPPKSVKDQLIDLLEHNPGLLQSVIDTVMEDTSSSHEGIVPPIENVSQESEKSTETGPASQWLSKPWF